MHMLVSWIGNADLRAPGAEDNSDIGPIAQAIEAREGARDTAADHQHPDDLISSQ